MGALFGLAAVGVAGAAFVAIAGVFWLLLKLIFLPIRLAIGAVKLVLGLVFGLLGMIAMVVLAPVLVVGVGGVALVAVVIAGLAVMLPLLPFLLIGALAWSFFKRPAVAA